MSTESVTLAAYLKQASVALPTLFNFMSRPKTIEPLSVTYITSVKLNKKRDNRCTVLCTKLQSIGQGDFGLIDCRGAMIKTVHHDMLVAVIGNPVLSKYHEKKQFQVVQRVHPDNFIARIFDDPVKRVRKCSDKRQPVKHKSCHCGECKQCKADERRVLLEFYDKHFPTVKHKQQTGLVGHPSGCSCTKCQNKWARERAARRRATRIPKYLDSDDGD